MIQETIQEKEYTEISDPAVMALTPLVSVLMITYNHGPYLADAIEGVIAQQADFPIELLIGEDCSTDNTREVALDYQRRYPQLIRVIYSEKNVGMHENFKRALRKTRGQLIALCEGDDYWINQEKLQVQFDVLSRLDNIDLTFHSCYLKYEKYQNKVFLSCVHSSNDKVITLSEIIAGDGGFMPTASILVRRNLLISIQDWFNEEVPVGDYFVQVFGSRRGGAYYVNKPMSIYRKDVEVSWVERVKKADALLEFEKKFFLSLKQLEYSIPGQEKAFNRLIISHYSGRFITAKNRNHKQLERFTLSVLKDRTNKFSIFQKIKVFLLQEKMFIYIFLKIDFVLYLFNKLLIKFSLK